MKKSLIGLALALVVSLPLAAQPGQGGPPPAPHAGAPDVPGPGGPGGPGPNAEQVLKDFLGLSDAQLQQLHSLLDARNQAGQQLQQNTADAQKALANALGASTPDPATVGSALLALNALQKQHGEIQKAFQTGFDGLLTADQKTKLHGLAALEGSLQALGAAHGIGV